MGRPRTKTKEDQERLDAIGNIPCVCCFSMHVQQPSPTERHHVVDKGYRRLSGGHQATVALCGWHHRAIPVVANTAMSEAYMLRAYGPSMKHQGGKGAFERCYGTQRELIEQTNRLLGAS